MLDTTDYVARLVHVETLTAGVGSKYIAEADGKMSFALTIPVTSPTSGTYPMYAQMGLDGWDGYLYWWGNQDAGDTIVYVYVLE